MAIYNFSCEWVYPPDQHSLVFKEGTNKYRNFYKIEKPLKFLKRSGDVWDEGDYYQHFQRKIEVAEPDTRKLE